MKTLNFKFSFLLLFFMLFSTNIYAQTVIIDTDTFDSSTDGWSGPGVSWDTDKLLINRGKIAKKTYTFPSFANKTVTFTLDATEIGSWWSFEYLYINVNQLGEIIKSINGTETLTFDVILDSSGSTEIGIRPDTIFQDKKISIDNIIVTHTYPPIPPTLSSEAFTIDQSSSIGTLIGTVSATPYATSFSIISGDSDNLFSIDNSGNITVNDDLTTRSMDTYTIYIRASNDYGVDEESTTIEITNLSELTGGRDFVKRTQFNLFGDIKVIGNTVLCILDDGVCLDPPDNNISNLDSDLEKAPQSYSTLILPSTATVEYARIYWQGRQEAIDDEEDWDADDIDKADKIKLKKGAGGTYVELTADIVDLYTIKATNYVHTYSSSADASSIVDGNGTYYVDTDSFYTSTGESAEKDPIDGLGNYGAWMLVVIYKDPDETKARSITLFDGYIIVEQDDNIHVDVDGFITPNSGVVDSKTYIFVGEGDKYLPDDEIQMAGATFNTNLIKIGTLDSNISIPAVREPNLGNNNGIDIQMFDTGTTPGAKNIITNNETGARFNFTSNEEIYFASVIAFSTEIYLPQLCYDYSIKQDGSYLDFNRTAYPIARINSTISSSDLDITVYVRNMDSDFSAEGISIRSDVNESKFAHNGNMFTSNVNGSTLIDRGAPTTSVPLCSYDILGDNSVSNTGCTDGYNMRKGIGTLYAYEHVYTKFSLSPLDLNGLVNVNEPLGLSLKYYITAGGNKIEYPEYVLGSDNVPICPPSNVYEPTWGQFNVVQSGSTANNIYTQISRNPFNASVIFDSTPSTGNNEAPTSDINTTVLVEIIDMGSFGDINASCANPGAVLSTPIFVPIEFTPSNFQTPLATQPASYYNFAVKNAAFRIWYFADANGSLIQNWTATVDNNNTSVNSISGLYQSAAHATCSTQCSADDTSVNCFDCIRANFAQPLCSRDNFSIRPESYNVKIYDINHTASAALKDSTKYNISNQDGFNPTSVQTTERMNLAAGYDYRYDIDATGYDGIAVVPRYTRQFSNNPDYSAKMIWDPQAYVAGCNDDSNVSLSFYIGNGAMVNQEHNHSNIGQYKINLTDKSWTAVDYSNNAHHIAANSFTTDDDCQVGSTASIASNGRYGCTISTNHGSDNYDNYYQDHDVEFFPYKFSMTGITPSHGIEHNMTFTSPTYIYMADMELNSNQDQNMSFHLDGLVSAQGKNGTILNNFVDNCYAKDVDLTVVRSNEKNSTTADHRFVFHNKDTAIAIRSGSMNNLSDSISLNTNDFNQSSSGSIDTILNLNFDRNVSVAQNPQTLTFTKYNADCRPASSCQMNADLNTAFQTKGSMDLNQTTPNTNITINYLYARSYAPRAYFASPANQDAFIFYEVYCSGSDCEKTLLPNGVDSNTTDDPRWFINTNHVSNYGTAGAVNKRGYAVGSGSVTQTVAPTGNHKDFVTLTYDESNGYPYKTTMQLNSSNWLIYNKYNNAATINEFEIEYAPDATSWGGKAETNSTTNEGGASTTNRRFMW